MELSERQRVLHFQPLLLVRVRNLISFPWRLRPKPKRSRLPRRIRLIKINLFSSPQPIQVRNLNGYSHFLWWNKRGNDVIINRCNKNRAVCFSGGLYCARLPAVKRADADEVKLR